MEEKADFAIIGGTASIDPGILREYHEIEVSTPHGRPSDTIGIGSLGGSRIAILPRHGRSHTIPPHLINFKANIDALHQLGVSRIISVATCGSLQENFKAGEVVVPDQFIDWSRQVHAFHGEGEFYHVSMADPFCPDVRKILIDIAKKLELPMHEKATYLKIDGPQFSTRAASRMYRQFADIIGMTAVPEAILARERQMCLAILATVTDFDVWSEVPVEFATLKKVMADNLENTRNILQQSLKNLTLERACICRSSLEGAEA
jgi:5'-methylthioadenosine phosphorylase